MVFTRRRIQHFVIWDSAFAPPMVLLAIILEQLQGKYTLFASLQETVLEWEMITLNRMFCNSQPKASLKAHCFAEL